MIFVLISTYLTENPSTTRENWIGSHIYVQNPGVFIDCLYSFAANHNFNSSCIGSHTWGNLHIPFQISTYINPSLVALDWSQYSLIITSSMSAILSPTYSYLLVEIIYIHCEEFFSQCGNGAVDQQFNGE